MCLKFPERKENLQTLIDKLDNLKQGAYKSGFDASKSLGGLTDAELQLLSEFEDLPRVTAFKGEDFISAISSVVNKLKDLPEITLIMAFEPTHDFKQSIFEDLEGIYGTNLVVTMKVNPRILGGLIVEYQGRYCDYSIQNKVNEFFKNN